MPPLPARSVKLEPETVLASSLASSVLATAELSVASSTSTSSPAPVP